MTATTMRRAPRQQRGQQRIDELLNAAEVELVEAGISALTTNAIAARAGASIGTLYQFFPNKEAIIAALAQRYTDQMRAALAIVRAPLEVGISPEQWIDSTVEALMALHRDHPGFTVLFCDQGLSPDLVQADAALQQETFEGTIRVLSAWAPDAPPAEIERYAVMSIAIVKAGLFLALEHPDPRAILADLKQILLRYLEPVLGRHIVAPSA